MRWARWLNRRTAPPPADVARGLTQMKFAETIGWIVDRFDVTASGLEMSGWALHPTADAADLRFRLNDGPFADVAWPLPSQDVARYFPALPQSRQCRFVCRHPAGGELFPDGYATVACVPPYGVHVATWRRAQYFLDPALEGPLPEKRRLDRVIQGDAAGYRIGGATLAKRIDAYLTETFARPLAGFESVLDWGCGAGRLTRHLTRLCAGAVHGADIDADNVGWCAANVPTARFATAPLLPPLPYDDASFDLIVGISVFTHLDEPTQHAWLGELRRVARPNALVLVSVHGLAQMAFYGIDAAHLATITRQGIAVLSQNDQLAGAIADATYYKNVFHSHDYLRAAWTPHFEIVDIIESVATHQDLVVMRPN